MRLMKSTCFAATIFMSGITAASAEVNVVTSIKPVHSLVTAVMEGVGKPALIIEGTGSPHHYALKPSQARLLQNAELVFWIGPNIETFLESPIEGIATNAISVPLIDSHGLIKISIREGGDFDSHDHDDHADHDDHDDHADHDDHDDHGGFDQHIWLDPVNAKVMLHEIETALSAADPQHASIYAANAEGMIQQLDALIIDVQMELEPVKHKGYIVFHDAYQYYENRFGMSAVGSITVSPETMPGAKRVSELQEKLRALDATCVFSEPQFEPKLVATIIENTNARTGVLDPLGASIPGGADHYISLIRNMTHALKTCLSEKG